MDLTAKRKRNGLRMKHQDSASSVSRSFSLSSDFPSVACFRCRMPFERMVGRGKVFGLNLPPAERIQPENLASAISAMRYLCIRASGTSD